MVEAVIAACASTTMKTLQVGIYAACTIFYSMLTNNYYRGYPAAHDLILLRQVVVTVMV